MNLEDRLPPVDVRRVKDDLAIEPSGAEQSMIEDIGPVGRRQQDDSRVGLETVHLDQQLVQGLLSLVVDRAQMDTALAADCVELVDKDEAGGLGLGLLETGHAPGGPDPDKHFDEFAAAQRKKRDPGFAGHGPCQQGLARSRRPKQEHAFGYLGSQCLVSLGVAEEIDDLHQLGFRLVATGHVVESHAGLLFGNQPRGSCRTP